MTIFTSQLFKIIEKLCHALAHESSIQSTSILKPEVTEPQFPQYRIDFKCNLQDISAE